MEKFEEFEKKYKCECKSAEPGVGCFDCNNQGWVFDMDIVELVLIKQGQVEYLEKKIEKYEAEGCLMCQAFIEGSEEWEQRAKDAEKKIDKLVEALRFYAEYNANADGEGIYEKTYTNSSMFKVTEPDCGSTARQTLKELRLE